jgi:hypothetical protein
MPHDTPMTNMKMSPSEAKEYASPSALAEAPQYPYGLRIDLNDESLEKLGIGELPAVGSKKVLYAIAEVVRVSHDESMGGPARKSLTLQITDLSCKSGGDAPAKPKRDPSDALYGTPEANNLVPILAAD